ncbi:N-acetyltransferase family protein [Roseobacteraceae bacterium S113]
MNIKPTTRQDLPALQSLLGRIELFPAEMLPDMIGGFLGQEDAPDIWLTCHEQGQVLGFLYAMPEMLAEGAWNMLAIGVDPDHHGSGAGRALVQALEDRLRQEARILIVDTSSGDDFAGARAFYTALGYEHEATIRDYWAQGEDKVTFRKAL